MYEEYGEEFLSRIRGMFALAIYDKRGGLGRERLILARDHLGIKPLLYARMGSAFIFSSEMKSILRSGLIDRKFDAEALRTLVTYGSIPQPMTAISGVKMLLPGHRLIIESGRERIERFWQLGIDRFAGLRKEPYDELVGILRCSLEECVQLQMMSDVSGAKVKTFSVGFGKEGAHIDETDDADRVAKFIGTDHTRVLVTGQDLRDGIMRIAEALDQPSVDGVNSYFVAEAATRAVTVAISGTGGDELFAGYPWFMNMVKAWRREKQNRPISTLKKIVAGISRHKMFNRLAASPWGGLLEQARGSSGFIARYAREYQIFGIRGACEILNPEIRQLVKIGQEPSREIAFTDEVSTASPIKRVTGLCLRGYTQNQLLRDIDAVSMAHSLEVRVPFLDCEIVDMALSLPDDVKLGNIARLADPVRATYGETGAKRILIDTGRGIVPDGMDLRHKRGFGMPFDSWLKGSLRDVFDDALSLESVGKRGFFDTKGVQMVRDQFLAGKIDWTLPWLLIITELWCREVLDKSTQCQFD
jgi:asparagine synthase (glutamine-hydrolysing)